MNQVINTARRHHTALIQKLCKCTEAAAQRIEDNLYQYACPDFSEASNRSLKADFLMVAALAGIDLRSTDAPLVRVVILAGNKWRGVQYLQEASFDMSDALAKHVVETLKVGRYA